jgi:type I restriction enzyme S subunit
VSSDLLAAVPQRWLIPPVYARFSVQLGKMLDEKRIAGTRLAPYLRNVDVQWRGVNTADLPEMDFDDGDRETYSLRKGDLLVCEGGEVGRTAIWSGDLAECYFQKAIHRLRPITDADDPRFFRYFMRMAVDSGVFAQAVASTIQHLTAEKLRVVRYPAPPVEEQRAIADYLDRETTRLDGRSREVSTMPHV